MPEFKKKTALGLRDLPENGQECTHVLLTHSEYDGLLAKVACAERDARSVYTAASQKIAQAERNENGETIVGRIGIDTYYHGSYEDLLHDQRRSARPEESRNIMLKPRLRANYKTGYWEVIFLHTRPLGLVPGDMRARH
jgi:hypothetical protein